MTPVQRERALQQKRRAVLIVTVSAVFILFAVYKVSIFGRAPGLLDDELKGAAQDGLPLTAADLRRQTAVPPDQNGAGAMEAAFAKYRNWSKSDGTWFAKLTRSRLDSVDPAKAEQFEANLATASPIFDQLKFAATYPKLVFQRDWEKGPGVTFPEFSDAHDCRQLLLFRFQVQFVRGETNNALDTLDTMAKVGALLGQDPTMVGILAGSNERTAACDGIAKVLQAHGSDRGILERCRTVLAELGPQPDIRKSLGSDFLMGLTSAKFLGTPGAERMFGDSDNVSKIGRFGPAKVVMELRYVQQMRAILHTLNTVGSDNLKIRNALNELDATGSDGRDWSNGLVNVLGSAYGSMASVVAADQARSNVMVSAIDLLEAKLSSGAFPVTLPGKTGSWLDPFTDKPLIYKPTKAGFLVYSFGPDGKDDGGQPRGKNSSNDSYDIPFSYP